VIVYSLSEPPMDGQGDATSNFMIGMLHGIMEKILGLILKIEESSFDRSKNILTLKMAGNRPDQKN
jgi:hypothetical protein